jgi:hypothetical protein
VFPTLSLFEFRLRLEHCPTKPSHPHRSEADTSHGLSFPTAHQDSKVHLVAGFACPLRSALRVWLPSRRLSPFESLPVLFRTGGAPGIPPSELSPLERSPNVSARPDPPTVFLSVAPDARPGRTAEPRFLGFVPFESPLHTDTLLTRRSRMLPWVLSLPGCTGRSLVRDFARTPPSRLARHGPKDRPTHAPRSLNQLRSGPFPLIGLAEKSERATLIGFSCRAAPTHSRRRISGL